MYPLIAQKEGEREEEEEERQWAGEESREGKGGTQPLKTFSRFETRESILREPLLQRASGVWAVAAVGAAAATEEEEEAEEEEEVVEEEEEEEEAEAEEEEEEEGKT
jgi:hypothetical protein